MKKRKAPAVAKQRTKAKTAKRRAPKKQPAPAAEDPRPDRTPRLNERQRRFVEAFMGEAMGVATTAARLAGYRGGEKALSVTASRLLGNARIRAALADRQATDPMVVAREEAQQRLSLIFRGELEETAKPKDRLKAVELLGRMGGWFITKHEVTGKDGQPIAHQHEVRIGPGLAGWSDEQLEEWERLTRSAEDLLVHASRVET